jgi:hypothetical protein
MFDYFTFFPILVAAIAAKKVALHFLTTEKRKDSKTPSLSLLLLLLLLSLFIMFSLSFPSQFYLSLSPYSLSIPPSFPPPEATRRSSQRQRSGRITASLRLITSGPRRKKP